MERTGEVREVKAVEFEDVKGVWYATKFFEQGANHYPSLIFSQLPKLLLHHKPSYETGKEVYYRVVLDDESLKLIVLLSSKKKKRKKKKYCKS